jgi:hypothetical protein
MSEGDNTERIGSLLASDLVPTAVAAGDPIDR